jgi:hypothetical protein
VFEGSTLPHERIRAVAGGTKKLGGCIGVSLINV